ncbi:hypothetical protein L1987_32168 [Smallanthus sonchifolius]|uniref:Uncharacterized protein n=1 Tax=Smallanthus sonchifolius TaxID=185202 RepID=A0ACB9I940_9ASTR|nr:hypothetical protein L1987_32168 [Smallanthus sonchifolius]
MATNNVAQVVLVEEDGHTCGNRVQPFSSAEARNEQWEVDHGKKEKSLTLRERLGLEDLYSLNVWRASVGELLGSAVLVFMIDTIVISSFETQTKTPNVLMSILIGITITILLLAVFPISGGHMNPVISFSAALVGLISLSRAFIYIFAQCVGALLGALALQAVVSHNISVFFTRWVHPHGYCTRPKRTRAKALGVLVVFSIIGTILGLLVFISTSLTGKKGYAGAGMNPARCLGPAMIRGGHLWDGHWVFWVGPAISCMAFYIYTKIIPSNHFHANGYRHDFFCVLRALI